MFSQYSWGDFFVFYFTIAALFYAFVLWKYKRHEIRDWIQSRGKKEQPAASATDEEENEEEEVAAKFYQVSSYSGTQSRAATDPVDNAQSATQSRSQAPSTRNEQTQPAELPGAEVLVDDQPSGFELPILVEGYRPQEQSMDEILETAKGLVVDEKGVVAPADPADKKAAKLAMAVNEQQGNRVFGDMPFSR